MRFRRCQLRRDWLHFEMRCIGLPVMYHFMGSEDVYHI